MGRKGILRAADGLEEERTGWGREVGHHVVIGHVVGADDDSNYGYCTLHHLVNEQQHRLLSRRRVGEEWEGEKCGGDSLQLSNRTKS